MVQASESMGSSGRRDVNSVGILQDDDVAETIYLEVSVVNPITRKADGTRELVTTYAIYLETNDSAFTMTKSMVRRRYSDFETLRSILTDQHSSVYVPKLPGKTFLGKRFDQRFIQERCHLLQQFLKDVIDQPVFLSNKALHLFLQSSLTMDRVRKVVYGGESSELPHNSPPLILYPVDNGNRARTETGVVGILKQESCASLVLASENEHDCSVKSKHKHIRLGSGVVVCPYLQGEQQAVASSAPFNIPEKQNSPVNMRSCASDTCLDGATSTGSSLPGSKKRVSFFIEKENKRSLMHKVVEAHSSNQEVNQEAVEEQEQKTDENQNKEIGQEPVEEQEQKTDENQNQELNQEPVDEQEQKMEENLNQELNHEPVEEQEQKMDEDLNQEVNQELVEEQQQKVDENQNQEVKQELVEEQQQKMDENQNQDENQIQTA